MSAARAFGRKALLDLHVVGGPALMLASNFRFASKDLDAAPPDAPRPDRLDAELAAIGREQGWPPDRLNGAVRFHLSPLASRSADHHGFGAPPRRGDPGLRVSVPTAGCLRALKRKAVRADDPRKGAQEMADIQNLPRAAGARTVGDAVACPARVFPRSAADRDRQRFFLRHSRPQGPPDEPPPHPV